ncbi:MAG: DUF2948 family protein [Alphaproteobacteria bacterium]
MAGALHLRAEDAEDLAVLSSCLQDALVPLADMTFERAARRFVLAVNRFRWEGCAPPLSGPGVADGVFERVACGITFEGVESVGLQGIDQGKREKVLELLAVMTDAAAAGRVAIHLLFAGGATIRLDADAIRVRLEDFGEAWPTKWRPQHQLES